MLAAISDGKLLTWFYPNAIYVDRDLMKKAMAIKDASVPVANENDTIPISIRKMQSTFSSTL
jgi:hypothetical protein